MTAFDKLNDVVKAFENIDHREKWKSMELSYSTVLLGILMQSSFSYSSSLFHICVAYRLVERPSINIFRPVITVKNPFSSNFLL